MPSFVDRTTVFFFLSSRAECGPQRWQPGYTSEPEKAAAGPRALPWLVSAILGVANVPSIRVPALWGQDHGVLGAVTTTLPLSKHAVRTTWLLQLREGIYDCCSARTCRKDFREW
ncbi:hypothetical protein MRX96_040102 [Rhipicephalus microplus]